MNWLNCTSGEMRSLLEEISSRCQSTERADLQGLVALADLFASLEQALAGRPETTPLASYAKAAGQATQRIVLAEVPDAAAALTTLQQISQWLAATLNQADAPTPPEAEVLANLKRDSGLADLGVGGNTAATGSQSASPVTLDDIAIAISTLMPGDTAGLVQIKDRLAEWLAQCARPQSVSEMGFSALQVLVKIMAVEPGESTDKLMEMLGTLVDGIQEAADNPTAASTGCPSDPASPTASAGAAASSDQSPLATNNLQSAEATSRPAQTPASQTVQQLADSLQAADPALLADFVTECLDHIENAEASLLKLETDPTNAEAVNAVFRAFHTIKGTSAFLGFGQLQQLAHLAETMLDRARSGKIQLTGGYSDLALEATDMLRTLVQSVQGSLGGEKPVDPPTLPHLLQVLADPEAAGVSAEASIADAGLRLGDILVAEGKADRVAVEVAAADQGAGPLGEALVKAKAASAKDVAGAIRLQSRLAGGESESQSVKVRIDRLDALINMVGELVIAQSMVSQDQMVIKATGTRLVRNVNHAGKITRELQDLSMSLRMVPLKSTFQKMARLVRDLAGKNGKSVRFVPEGEDTEIDRNMVEVINDPLVHMVRNALDHGLESPERRREAGKDPCGTVTLRAYHSSGKVVIELCDDGHGLNRDKIIAKAVAKGLIESAAGLTDAEIFDLIFKPGFSTADKVTEVSGRGVGMDVVKRGVEALRGKIDLASEFGRGSTFTMRLPLTLAIIDGMVIRVGEQRYIIPTAAIHTSFRPSDDNLSVAVGRGEMVMLHDQLMPLFRVYQAFGITNAETDPTKGLLLVVDDEGRKCALLVDDLLGQQQVVVKSLAGGIGEIKGTAGGAIMGDGRVGLIIDVPGFVSLARDAVTAAERSVRQPCLTA